MKRAKLLLFTGLLLAMPLSVNAFPGKDPKGVDCTKCHKLDKKDVEALVKKVAPEGKVTDIKVSPIKGVWQIDVEAGGGKKGSMFLDFSKKFVIAQIIPIESVGKQAPPKKVDASKIPLDDAMVVGLAAAKKKVIVFTDPDCPYCRQLHPIMKQIVEKRKDIAFYLILNPLPMHKDAYKKIQAILCSKSMEQLDDAFSGKAVPEPPAACSAEAVERNKALAASLEFSGTPMLVHGNGFPLTGYLPEDKLLEWIDK